MMEYVDHPLIRPESIEARVYQQVILDSARQGNTLVVLPTGLGKTQIAVMLTAHRMHDDSDARVLMMAPTRPLVLQHAELFEDSMTLKTKDFKVLTGKIRPDERVDIWRNGRVFFATPQTVERDMISGRMHPSNFDLMVFDEAHRAVGDYSYVFIAERYRDQAEDPLILALTASPGGSKDRVEDVKENLEIERVEVRSENHPNVKPYVQPIELEREMLELPEPVAKIKKFLERQLKDHLKSLKDLGFLDSIQNVGKKELLDVQKKIKKKQKEMSPNPPREIFKAMMDRAAAFRLSHSIELLESQGLESLDNYLERMESKSGQSGAPKSLRMLLNDPRMKKVIRLVRSCAGRVKNPKVQRLKEIVDEQISEKPQSRIIVFAHYRDSVDKLVGVLEKMDGIRPERFIGQASRGNADGLTQKEQAWVIERFREGDTNLLVSTSVGEEGLDIPGVDLAIFYEPVPSEIRNIQRRGRTGRSGPGRVVVLIMKGTRDEAFYWSAVHKENRMKKVLRSLDDESDDESQSSLDEFRGVESS
ncbi:MAG: helicase-related protein [Candidatus Hadarchaeia archaeon]